jgi:group II intron reverse transcriptase/maturase
MEQTASCKNISTRLSWIAELSRRHPANAHTTLAHHIDKEFLKEAYRRTRKDGAVGVDGTTATEYAQTLESNLEGLLSRFKSGRYVAPPVRRVHIPKGDGTKTRPIGIPAFEDKVLQRAVTMVLEAVYEPEFIEGSYGFRPGRSAHHALEAIWKGAMAMDCGWVIEADIESFFDRLDHRHLREFLDRRVRDGVIRRVIGKWLNAGVLENGQLYHPETGSPQGGVVSPILSNIYLHEVLDLWFEREVRPRLHGRAQLVRYADDFVILFQLQADAERVMTVLPKRFGKYGLALHPDKTRIVRFERPRVTKDGKPCHGGSRTFDFLGFSHYWGRSRKGNPIVQRQTAKNRLARAIQRVTSWCKTFRHEPVAMQHRALNSKLRGHYSYYGITGNARSLGKMWFATRRVWRYWLDKRGGKRRMKWDRYASLLKRHPLASPRIVHSAWRLAANA